MDSATYRLSQVIRGSPHYIVVITLLFFVQIMSMLLFLADYFSYIGPFYPSIWTGIYLTIIGATFVFAARSARIKSLSDLYNLYQQSLLPFQLLYSMLLWFIFLYTVSTTLAYSPFEIVLLEGVFVQLSGLFYLIGQLLHLVLIQVLLWNPADYSNISMSEVIEKTTDDLDQLEESETVAEETGSVEEETTDSSHNEEGSLSQKS